MSRWRQWLTAEHGYTAIEMIAVIAITAILSALVIANTNTGNKRQQLRDAMTGYVTAAKQAEAMAASNQPVPPAAPAEAAFPRSAYGVCITSSKINNSRCGAVSNSATQPLDTYQVYARNKNDTNYTARPNNPDIISSYKTPSSVIFANQAIWIDYLPPGPDLLANGSSNSSPYFRIIGQVVGNSSYTKRVVINPKAGAVYAE